jgi:hypothetical protein
VKLRVARKIMNHCGEDTPWRRSTYRRAVARWALWMIRSPKLPDEARSVCLRLIQRWR